GYETDTPPHLPPVAFNVQSERPDRPSARPQQSAYRSDKSGFAGTVRTQQCKYLAPANPQVDPAKRGGAALVGLRKVADIENRVFQSPAKMTCCAAIARRRDFSTRCCQGS